MPNEATTEDGVLVTGSPPADLSGFPVGPEIEGFVSARAGNKVEVTEANGNSSMITIGEGTEIKASGGFLGLARDQLGMDQLLNGIPVKVETVQWGSGLVASKVRLKASDLKTAQIVQSGTQQKFAQQGAAIGENKLATERNAQAAEALRGRFGDIDKYNVKGTTNVYFDTGKYSLSPASRTELCEAAEEADAMENALLLVVGYTDSTGSYEINQELSEKRAGRVVNYLQQQCGWKPYRMLAPSGFADSDPTADNSTAEGRAQNRRVAVNVLVSKSVDGM
ncbi:MAG: OmpA family protein [Pseudomonadota bacterium]